MLDEIMIDRLSAAYDRQMSAIFPGGMYDFDRYDDPFTPAPVQPEIPQGPSTARIISMDEWNLILALMTDEERERMAYEG